MKFFLANRWLVLGSLPAGVAFYFFLRRWLARSAVSERLRSAAFQRSWVVLNAAFLFVVLTWGYGHGTAYYHPRYDGAVGDSYHYMADTLADPSYFNAQHLVYPVIPGAWIRFLERKVILSGQDPDFYEKAFYYSGQPNRLFAVCGLLVLLWCFWRARMPWLDILLTMLLMALSAGSWVWAHQSNAMGFAIGLELMAAAFFLRWFDTQDSRQLAALALILGLCVYAQAATIYFVVTFYFYISVLLWTNRFRLSAWLEWLLMTSELLLLGAAYYWFAARWSQTFDPKGIFRRVADTNLLGSYELSPHKMVMALKDNLVNCVLNLFNIWDPKTVFDKALIASEMTLFIAVVCAVLSQGKESVRIVLKQNCLIFFCCSTIIFSAFLVRDAGSRYFATITIPNVLLLSFLLLDLPSVLNRVLLQALTIVMFLYSGFSSINVFETARVDGSICYRINQLIVRRLTPIQSAIYIGYYDFHSTSVDGNIYRDQAIKSYYGTKFRRIEWISDPRQWTDAAWLRRHLPVWMREKTPVYLSDDALDFLQPIESKLIAQHLDINLNQLIAL